MSFDGWLDARDSETVTHEWGTLGARRIQLGQAEPRYLAIQPEGAALLAATFLGCSPTAFAWFATDRAADAPAPTFHQRSEVSRSFVDEAHDVTEAGCFEVWTIRESVVGSRGVHHITIDCTWGEQSREGGNGRSSTIVRVFDRSTQRAVSIPLHSTAVWVVGEVDLSPLDLFSQRVSYKLRWTKLELAAVRGFIAQITADLDAHFDTSAEWDGEVTRDEVLESEQYDFRTRRRELRFASGGYAIELGENLDPDLADDPSGMFWVVVHGLPWGHEVNVRISLTGDEPPTEWGVDGWIDLTLPRAQLEAAVARVAKIPGISVQAG